MSYASAAIRTSIKELLQGSIGTTRTVSSGKFRYGVFEGQPLGAQQAKAINTSYTSRFDIKLRQMVDHGATPMSIKSSFSVARFSIEIPIVTTLRSTAQETERDTDLALVASDCDVAIQALCYPGNLTQTSAAVATGIVSGLMVGPEGTGRPHWESVEEDWENHLLRSRISGSVSVVISQAVS